MSDEKVSTLAYTYNYCTGQAGNYQNELITLRTKLLKQFDDMDFENAKEKDDMFEHLNTIVNDIDDILETITDTTFEV